MTQTQLSGQLIRNASISASVIIGEVVSASFATTASFALNAGEGGVAFPFSGDAIVTGSLLVSGSGIRVTGSLNVTAGMTGSLLGTSSWATNAVNVEYANVTNKPAIVSASSQVSYTGISNVPSGIVSASSQVSYTGLSSIPAGILSSSTQINSLSGVSASFATSASRAQTSSFATSVNYDTITNRPALVSASSQVSYTGLSSIPAGILSSSTQINSLSGVSASFATTASFALNAAGGGGAAFPFSGSAVVTGSLLVSGSGIAVSGSMDTDRYSLKLTSLGNASGSTTINLATGNYFIATTTAATSWSITNTPTNRAVGFVLALTSGGFAAQTWPSAVKWPSATPPTLTAAGQDTLTFITDNGGTTWRGVLSIKDSR